MKISALAGVLICFLAAPESTKCQEFKGLQNIGILIEDLDKEAANIGLTSESLRDQILVALKRDIPKLKIDSSPFPLRSYVHLQITSAPILTYAGQVALGDAAFVLMSLERPTKIIGDDGTEYVAAVSAWKTGVILHDSFAEMPSSIREKISEAMTRLAAEYYKQNP